MTITPKLNGQGLKLPRGVLFDYDGVLVASESIHLSAWMQLLAEIELPLDSSVKTIIDKGIGKTAPEIIAVLLDIYRPGWSPAEYDVQALARRKGHFYANSVQQSLRLYPGVMEGVQWLKSQKIAMAIVSNGRRPEIEKTMQLLGLAPLIKTVISREDAPAFKPHPIHYLTGAASLGIEPQDCLAVEDSPTGLESALLAKIPAAAVATNFPESVLAQPVPGRPDLKPAWVGPSIQLLFKNLTELATQ